MSPLLRCSSLALALLVAAGCSSDKKPGQGDQPGAPDHLREVAGMLQLFAGRKGPEKVADLARYEAGFPLGYQAVKSGEIVIVWGTTMPGEGDQGGTDKVVAYEKKALTEGGHVLLHNGTIKKMTAEELKAAPKAK